MTGGDTRNETKAPIHKLQMPTTKISKSHNITSEKLAGLVKKVENVVTMNAIVITTPDT